MKKPDVKRLKDLDLKELQAKEPAIIKEFKEFINRGNVVDLAIGVVIGGAFSSIVTSLVNNIVMPVVSMLIGGIDFSHLSVTVPSFLGTSEPAEIKFGLFIESVVDFLIIAFVIFLVVRALNKFQEAAKAKLAAEETKEKKAEKKQDNENTKLLREIRDALVTKKK